MIRRRLAAHWPWISRDFGVRPWELERLTWRELRVLVDAVNDLAEARRRKD